MTTTMNEGHLHAVMDAMPDEANEAELCALMLTIYSAYIGDPVVVISSLIAAIYAYGESKGLDRSAISMGLRAMADMHDSKPETWQ